MNISLSLPLPSSLLLSLSLCKYMCMCVWNVVFGELPYLRIGQGVRFNFFLPVCLVNWPYAMFSIFGNKECRQDKGAALWINLGFAVIKHVAIFLQCSRKKLTVLTVQVAVMTRSGNFTSAHSLKTELHCSGAKITFKPCSSVKRMGKVGKIPD